MKPIRIPTVEYEQPIRSCEILKFCANQWENSYWSKFSREIQKRGFFLTNPCSEGWYFKDFYFSWSCSKIDIKINRDILLRFVIVYLGLEGFPFTCFPQRKKMLSCTSIYTNLFPWCKDTPFSKFKLKTVANKEKLGLPIVLKNFILFPVHGYSDVLV